MSILKVARMGNPILRKPAEPVPPDDIKSEKIQTLIDDMFETKNEYLGVGLAAPQVHVSKQIVVFGVKRNERYPNRDDIQETVLINPRFVQISEQREEDWEGCLSVPDIRGKVPRATEVVVEGYDRNGKLVRISAEGFFARALQHEIDHLHGKLFIDRIKDTTQLAFMDEFMKYWL